MQILLLTAISLLVVQEIPETEPAGDSGSWSEVMKFKSTGGAGYLPQQATDLLQPLAGSNGRCSHAQKDSSGHQDEGCM